MDETISKLKNRVFEQQLAIGKNIPTAMATNENFIYRVTGYGQIADIINTGYVRCKEGKINGGHELELFWTHGGDKLFYFGSAPILETSIQKLHDNQIGALTINDLTSIWLYDDVKQQYVNYLPIILMIGQFCLNDNLLVPKEDIKTILTHPLIGTIQETGDVKSLIDILSQFHFNQSNSRK